MCVQEINVEQSDAFAGRMLEIVNDGLLALQISVASQVGLFETLAESGPVTVAEAAAGEGLDERYVRELLGGLVVGKILTYEPTDQTYELPAEHAAFLTAAAGPDNLASFTQYVALLGEVEQDVVHCVREGGGVPYSKQPRFQSVQAAETSRVYDATLVDVQLPLAPGLVERLRSGIDVLEIGCGQGHASNLMADAFPASRFKAFDISEEGIAAGRAEAERLGLTNLELEVRDGAELGHESFDLVAAFDVIHDLARPRETLRAIHNALRPGGVFFMADIKASSNLEDNIDHPLGPALFGFSLFHCMTVSLAQDGEGLGTVWGEQLALELLAEAGFSGVDTHEIEDDIINTYYVATKK
jgi:SAM-dependent methyltransferase